MRISEIRFSVIVHEGESYDEIKRKLFSLLKDIDLKKIEFYENIGEGLLSSKLYYIYVKIKRKEDIKKFLKNLIEKGLDINDLLKNMNFDENFNVYVRFDKKSLIEDNRVIILYGDDTFHLKISIDGYKKNKDNVTKFLMDYFREISNL